MSSENPMRGDELIAAAIKEAEELREGAKRHQRAPKSLGCWSTIAILIGPWRRCETSSPTLVRYMIGVCPFASPTTNRNEVLSRR